MPTSEESETLCGIGYFRPQYLQKFASKKPYVFIYGCIGIIQSMMGTYLGAMLSTLERRFGIKSKESAYLLSGNEITQILFLFILPFVIKVKRRPLWMAVALFISGLGCIMMGLPYLITEHQFVDLYDVGDEIPSNSKSEVAPEINNDSSNVSAGMCGSDVHPNSLEKLCDEDGNRKVDFVGLSLIFVGIFLTGVGSCFYYTFGLPYLDDNTSHENAPMWLGFIFVFKLIGPTMGYLLAGACLKIYDDPSKNPGFDETDPRWIGAWWFGPPFIGLLLILFSLPLTLFPQRLPKQNTDSAREKEKENDQDVVKSKEGFKPAMLRLIRNKLFMYNLISNYFYVFAFKGFGTFMQKYMEYQFRKTASGAALLGGGSVFTSAIGLLTSGLVLSKCKLSARIITGWNVVIMAVILAWLVLFGSIGCPTSNVYGEETENGVNINVGCNFECDCPVSRPDPICSSNGVTNFYSPCAAGCKGPIKFRYDHVKKKNISIYTECDCAVEAWETDHESQMLLSLHNSWDVEEFIHRDEAVKGWCEVDCSFEWSLFIGCAIAVGVLASSGRIGNVLVAMR